LSRLLFPAFAIVLLRLSVAADGSAKTRSPDRLPMAKLSNVALWQVPPMNAIAVPAAEIVPPPVAAMVAPLPWSATAAADGSSSERSASRWPSLFRLLYSMLYRLRRAL
jgi:hypothetical protein